MSRLRAVFVIFVTLAVSSLADGAKDDSIKVLTRDGFPIAGPALHYAALFGKREGIPVEIRQSPFRQLYDEIMIGFVTGTMSADVLLIPSAWLPDFAPYLSPVPGELINSAVVDDIHPIYRDALMRWEKQWMALTIDGDMLMGIYRKDLFVDPNFRKAFRGRFGRDLEPPATWLEYRQIAEFFHGQEDHQGRRLAGTLEAYSRGGQRLWYLFGHVAAYTNHPDFPGSMFFDPVTLKPSITNPAWRRALTDYIELSKSIPSDPSSLDSYQVRTRFSRGEAAMAIDWTDIGVLASSRENSVIADDIGFFMLPGSRQAWNPEKHEWEEYKEPRNVPFLAFGGWVGVVPRSSTDPQRAWSYLALYTDPELSINDVTDGTSGINPYRLSHLANAEPWHQSMGQNLADEYLSILSKSLESPFAARDLRIPGYRAYMATLDEQVEQILLKETSIEQALQTTAGAWEQITDRLGRNSQIRHYRAAMGLSEQKP